MRAINEQRFKGLGITYSLVVVTGNIQSSIIIRLNSSTGTIITSVELYSKKEADTFPVKYSL